MKARPARRHLQFAALAAILALKASFPTVATAAKSAPSESSGSKLNPMATMHLINQTLEQRGVPRGKSPFAGGESKTPRKAAVAIGKGCYSARFRYKLFSFAFAGSRTKQTAYGKLTMNRGTLEGFCGFQGRYCLNGWWSISTQLTAVAKSGVDLQMGSVGVMGSWKYITIPNLGRAARIRFGVSAYGETHYTGGYDIGAQGNGGKTRYLQIKRSEGPSVRLGLKLTAPVLQIEKAAEEGWHWIEMVPRLRGVNSSSPNTIEFTAYASAGGQVWVTYEWRASSTNRHPDHNHGKWSYGGSVSVGAFIQSKIDFEFFDKGYSHDFQQGIAREWSFKPSDANGITWRFLTNWHYNQLMQDPVLVFSKRPVQ